MKVPNYEHGILQAINTIRDYVGITTYYKNDKDIKNWIDTYKLNQIVVLLIDGMGAHQIDKYGKDDGFLKSNFIKKIDTVYPPTTVAATTAIQTGKSPCETGWLAWQQYFKNEHEHVIMFFNEDYYTKKKSKKKLPLKIFPIINMVEECKQNGICSKQIFTSWYEHGATSFQNLCDRIVHESMTQECKYIYAYWDEYDSIMHDYGASHTKSIKMLNDFDEILKNTMTALDSRTGLMIIADHGHINVRSKYLIDYPDLLDCLSVLPAFETRTVNFFVKFDKKEIFNKLFHSYFGDSFYLFSKDEVLQHHLFGKGKEHMYFRDMIGDYIACAFDDIQLLYDREYELKGHHAGMTKEEIEIPLILYNKK